MPEQKILNDKTRKDNAWVRILQQIVLFEEFTAFELKSKVLARFSIVRRTKCNSHLQRLTTVIYEIPGICEEQGFGFLPKNLNTLNRINVQ